VFLLFEPSFFQGEKWLWQSKLQYNQAIQTYNINNKASLDKYSYVPNFNFGVGFPF
jgi:hypothetical protein